MEPITLHFNETEYNYKLKQVNRVSKELAPILKQVAEINGLTWTPELFKNFITGNGSKAEAVIAKTAIQPLIKNNITSQTLLDEAASGDKAKYWLLYQAAKKILSATEYIGSGLLTVDQRGEIIIPETFKEQLKENYTITICTENGKALYDAQIQLIKTCNDILKLCGSRNGLQVIEQITDIGYDYNIEKLELEFFSNYDELTQPQ